MYELIKPKHHVYFMAQGYNIYIYCNNRTSVGMEFQGNPDESPILQHIKKQRFQLQDG